MTRLSSYLQDPLLKSMYDATRAVGPGRLKKIYQAFKMNVATNGKEDFFATALNNYRDDPRAFWYYTVAPGYADEIESVVEQCINNGNRVLISIPWSISHGS